MALLFGTLLLTLAAFYFITIAGFAAGFRRITNRASERNQALPFVSVIVPARDEAHCIGRCIEAIIAGDYPEDLYEVIVVDDLSRDETVQTVRNLQSLYNLAYAGVDDVNNDPPHLQLLQMPENLERTRAHKKRAIEKGIRNARGEIILTTDADCVMGPVWIRTMVSFFTGNTAFVSGPVLIHPQKSPLLNMQALEFLGLVAIGGGAIGIGKPNLCNGANVAYRRDVFLNLGGFSGIDRLTSGDDELLMQKIAYDTAWDVRFCPLREAATITDPVTTFRAFFEQRRRWASKGAHYPNPVLVAMIGGIYAFYVSMFAGLVASFFASSLIPWVLAGFILKCSGEYLLLSRAAREFGRKSLLKYFLPEQILHIPYIVVIGAAGALGGYRWKGRRIER